MENPFLHGIQGIKRGQNKPSKLVHSKGKFWIELADDELVILNEKALFEVTWAVILRFFWFGSWSVKQIISFEED